MASPDGQSSCVLIPSETAGPFPLDLTANSFFLRQDVREGRAGVRMNLKMKVISLSTCAALQNVRVHIWHCDKDGLYSGYDIPQNPGQSGLTYMRGWQMTNAAGEVDFITILPGWYTGRICHIHFQVYVNSGYSAVSQLTFDIATKNAIYAANSSVYTKGVDPLSFSTDNIFSDGYSYQLASLTQNGSGDYDSFLEVTVADAPTGMPHLEKENEKHFTLGQNYPNPYEAGTSIPLTLKGDAHVTIDLYDVNGMLVARILNNDLTSGDHIIGVNTSEPGLIPGNYIYQVEVRKSDKIFRDCRMMTKAK